MIIKLVHKGKERKEEKERRGKGLILCISGVSGGGSHRADDAFVLAQEKPPVAPRL